MLVEIKDYEFILVIGIVTLVCLEEGNNNLDITKLEYDLNKKIKLYMINNLNGVLPLKEFYKIIEIIDKGFASTFFKKINKLFIKLSYNGKIDIGNCENKRNKVNAQLLYKFILEKKGKWFKLSEFEEYFNVNKKTAWKHLNNLYNNGFLIHNGKKANKARYCFVKEKLEMLCLNNQRKTLNKNFMLPF